MANKHDAYGSDSDDSSTGGQNTNLTEAGNLSNRPPPKKRNRAALSCTLCRERKVKCDRVIPCQQCIKRGDAEFCHLDPSKRGPEQKKKGGRSSQSQSTDNVQQQQQQQQYVNQNVQYHPNQITQQQIEQFASANSMAPPYRQSSISSPSNSSASEVDAIKARLAQLEQLLQHRQSQEASPGTNDSSSAPGQSPRYPWQSGTGNTLSSFATSPMSQQAAGASPNNTMYQRANSSSSSRSDFATVFAQQQQQQNGSRVSKSPAETSLVGAMYPSSTSNSDRYTPHRSGSNQNLQTTNADTNKYNKETPSAHHPSSSGPKGEVDSDTEDAALVLEGLAMGRPGEDGKKNIKSQLAALEIIEKDPLKSIQGFVEEDRAEDIMTEGKYNFQKANDKGKDGKNVPSECPKEKCADDESTVQLREYLRKNPDALVGPDGQRLSPAKRVCVLLSQHESLFNLVWGPETHFGWGMGWAFAAAEAAGDMMKVTEVIGCKGAMQREAVLRAIIRSLPEREVAEHLVDVFDSRVKFLAGNCFHVPTFKKDMSAFYDLATVEKRARVINFVDPAWLSLMLMIFVLALHFHPCERPELVQHLFDGRTIHLWRSAAQTSLVLARYQSSSSMAVLQTIILINLLSMGQGKENFSLTHIAISNALDMGLHSLGDEDKQPKAGECSATFIRREMAKRIWHQLTFMDWCSATMHQGSYRIHPHQYNTPLPDNYNDTDLCKCPKPEPRPESEHTDMSYSLAMLKLADISRQNVDMMHSFESKGIKCADMAYLDTAYRGLLEQAPPFYRIGSDVGVGENIEVERWLFQQSVFHKLLRLHRPQISSRTSARTSCVLLARSILDMQRRIRSRCSVVDRLFINLAQSFSAAIVLCLDLLQTRPSATMRSIVRGEISEALKALRHVGASHHTTESSIRVIEALLEEEECRWNKMQNNTETSSNNNKRRRGDQGKGERRKDMLNLAMRVAKATQGHGNDDMEMADVERSSASGSHDIPVDPKDLQESIKDQQSRQMFDQLVAGRPSFAEPVSFSSSLFQTNLFEQPQGTVPPNGLDFGGYGWAPPTGTSSLQNFDLSKFLAEVETNSSPGNGDATNGSAASDSGHSSLHGGGTGSTSSGHLSHSSSFSNGVRIKAENGQQNASNNGGGDATLSPVDAFAMQDVNTGSQPSPTGWERSSNLDGFWNWVFTQGSSGFGTTANEIQPPLGGGGAIAYGLQQQQQQQNNEKQTTLPSNGEQQAQFMDALAQNIAGGMNANPVGNSVGQGGNGQASNNNPFNTGRTPSNNAAGGNSTTLNSSELPFYSVGTPSAVLGNSWMSTPGMFDFAYEFGGEGGPSASQSSGTSTNNHNHANQTGGVGAFA